MAIMHASKAPVRIVSNLPTKWPSSAGLLLQGDVRVTAGNLRAKVLLFKNQASMKEYWNKKTMHRLGNALAAVNQLTYEATSYRKGGDVGDQYIGVDARYFCMMGFLVKHLTLEILMHESVHASYAFVNRSTKQWWCQAKEIDEELVAYPAGIIAKGVAQLFRRNGYDVHYS